MTTRRPRRADDTLRDAERKLARAIMTARAIEDATEESR